MALSSTKKLCAVFPETEHLDTIPRWPITDSTHGAYNSTPRIYVEPYSDIAIVCMEEGRCVPRQFTECLITIRDNNDTKC